MTVQTVDQLSVTHYAAADNRHIQNTSATSSRWSMTELSSQNGNNDVFITVLHQVVTTIMMP